MTCIIVLIFTSCANQKNETCDSVLSADLRVSCLNYKPGREDTCMAVPFGESGINYRIFYGNNHSFRPKRYTLVGDIPSGKSIVIDPFSDYVDAYPVVDGKVCENRLIRRNSADHFFAVDDFGDWLTNEYKP